jgi:hypothetical protein
MIVAHPHHRSGRPPGRRRGILDDSATERSGERLGPLANSSAGITTVVDMLQLGAAIETPIVDRTTVALPWVTPLQFPDRWAPPGGRQVEIHLGNAIGAYSNHRDVASPPRITMCGLPLRVPHRSCGCPDIGRGHCAARSRDTSCLEKAAIVGNPQDSARVIHRRTRRPHQGERRGGGNAVAKNAPVR